MFMRNKETSNFVILNVQKTESKNNLKATKNIYKNLFKKFELGNHVYATYDGDKIEMKCKCYADRVIWMRCWLDLGGNPGGH